MMFYSKVVNILLTTIHVSLKNVAKYLTIGRFNDIIELGIEGMADLGIKDPRIGVCGLNPHAGEHGILGTEEETILLPVIKKFQAKGLKISEPLPADTLFIPQNIQKYDLIIAHYHDQGLIPLKMLAFDSAVNITVGLPIIRTSVDHGTAYGLVGKGIATYTSLAEAVRVAQIIAQNRFKRLNG
jgi:4-hydroxythreonine-4-phosphate dehydrogenase